MSAAKSSRSSGKEGIEHMSRIGRMPITVPAGVEVTIGEGNVVTVKGPKGTLTQTLRPEMIIKVEDGVHPLSPVRPKTSCTEASTA